MSLLVLLSCYPCTCGRAKALDLVSTLKASKLVVMQNAEVDLEGPLGSVVREGNTLESFLDLACTSGVEVIVPTATEGVAVWP